MSFAEFVRLALYDPTFGYYRRVADRVGRRPGTDFYTASSQGPLFGELIAAACASLLGSEDPREYEFVEIGAEDEFGIMREVAHPFRSVRTIRLGESLAVAGRCVVFSNELFDAQPFRRFCFRDGSWCEIGVAEREGELVEVELAGPLVLPASVELAAPDCARYLFDAPFEAATLASEIVGRPWSGLFVACDYGKSLRELVEATPAGTARAYYRHTQSNDLLARPGEQDLTCHVCWDWLEASLSSAGFVAPKVETQESFFVRHAGSYLQQTTAAEAARLSSRKLALQQLLHPAGLGQKFQVLHARR